MEFFVVARITVDDVMGNVVAPSLLLLSFRRVQSLTMLANSPLLIGSLGVHQPRINKNIVLYLHENNNLTFVRQNDDYERLRHHQQQQQQQNFNYNR